MRSYGIPPNLLMTASQVDRTGESPRRMGSKKSVVKFRCQMVVQQKNMKKYNIFWKGCEFFNQKVVYIICMMRA